jgi:hypothetical protein
MPKITLNYPYLLGDRNIRAFSRVVKVGESNLVDEDPYQPGGTPHSAYRAMYHPTRRKWWEGPLEGPHPRQGELLPDGSGRVSTAFGAYQFIWTTLQYLLGKYEGLENDISPRMQDCWFVTLLYDCGALDDVIDGRFDEALRKANNVWASLPVPVGDTGLEDGGSKVAYQRALEVWRAHGGGVPTLVAVDHGDRAEPVPIEDRSVPARPADVARINAAKPRVKEKAVDPLLIGSLIGSLMNIFAPAVQNKLDRALNKQVGDPAISAQMSEQLMELIKQTVLQVAPAAVAPAAGTAATTTPMDAKNVDPVVAAGVVRTNPEVRAAVEKRLDEYLTQIAPALDMLERLEAAAFAATEDSMDRASVRARSEAWDMAPTIVKGALWYIGGLSGFVCAIAAAQTFTSGGPSTEVWAAITGLIGSALGIAGTIVAYRFGRERQSTSAQAVASQLQRR